MDSNNKYSQLWKKIFTISETERGHLIVHLAIVIIDSIIVLLLYVVEEGFFSREIKTTGRYHYKKIYLVKGVGLLIAVLGTC